MDNDRWLSTEDIARRLGMSPAWARRQIVEGRIRAVAYDIGQRRTYRVREEWLKDFLVRYRVDLHSPGVTER